MFKMSKQCLQLRQNLTMNILYFLYIIVLYIVLNSFWAMSDLENPSNKSDFCI